MSYNLYLSFEGGRVNATHLYPYAQWMEEHDAEACDSVDEYSAEHDTEACDSVDKYSNDNSKKVTA